MRSWTAVCCVSAALVVALPASRIEDSTSNSVVLPLRLTAAIPALVPAEHPEPAPILRKMPEPITPVVENTETTGSIGPLPDLWATRREPIAVAGTFAHSVSHAYGPLPAVAWAAMTQRPDETDADALPRLDGPMAPAIEHPHAQLHAPQRSEVCRTIADTARENGLPVIFFANLIWQESTFRARTISHAGALGIAQFIPDTAVENGLLNPFEPIHAIRASGRLLRKLTTQFGNVGVAAAAYNAGPNRVAAWLAEQRTLPAETRHYVMRITGHSAHRWMTGELAHSPEALVMPQRAPCAEAAEELQTQVGVVRVARLMSALTDATRPVARPPQPARPAVALRTPPLPQRSAASAVKPQPAVKPALVARLQPVKLASVKPIAARPAWVAAAPVVAGPVAARPVVRPAANHPAPANARATPVVDKPPAPKRVRVADR